MNDSILYLRFIIQNLRFIIYLGFIIPQINLSKKKILYYTSDFFKSKIIYQKKKGADVHQSLLDHTTRKERESTNDTEEMPPRACIQSKKVRKICSIKDPSISFIPQIPHHAQQQSSPHLGTSMALKLTLPTFQQINHRFRHYQDSKNEGL